MYSPAIQSQVVAFGYRFLGPFLLDWYNRLVARSADVGSDIIYCLGREGWGIVPLFNMIEALRPDARRRFVYLPISRGLMTHISLADPQLADFGFNSDFNGTVRQFCDARLGVPFELLDLGAFAGQQVRLPRDRAFLLDLIKRRHADAIRMAERSRAVYGRYLERRGLVPGRRHILSDLGFRGTTQALLAGLYNLDITGYYALLDPSGVPSPLSLPPGSTHGLFSDEHCFGEGYAPLDQSLLFETFLTAPVGQISGVQDCELGDPFVYRESGSAQHNYMYVAASLQGAQKFALDHEDLIGSTSPLIADFDMFFDNYRMAIQDNIETFRPCLEVDDSFFGTDNLSAEIKL
jgi:hypothetical protein